MFRYNDLGLRIVDCSQSTIYIETDDFYLMVYPKTCKASFYNKITKEYINCENCSDNFYQNILDCAKITSIYDFKSAEQFDNAIIRILELKAFI